MQINYTPRLKVGVLGPPTLKSGGARASPAPPVSPPLQSVTGLLPSYSLVAVESVESYAVVTIASFEFVTFHGSMSKSRKDLGKEYARKVAGKWSRKYERKAARS